LIPFPPTIFIPLPAQGPISEFWMVMLVELVIVTQVPLFEVILNPSITVPFCPLITIGLDNLAAGLTVEVPVPPQLIMTKQQRKRIIPATSLLAREVMAFSRTLLVPRFQEFGELHRVIHRKDQQRAERDMSFFSDQLVFCHCICPRFLVASSYLHKPLNVTAAQPLA
jgi:hypothetical protein